MQAVAGSISAMRRPAARSVLQWAFVASRPVAASLHALERAGRRPAFGMSTKRTHASSCGGQAAARPQDPPPQAVDGAAAAAAASDACTPCVSTCTVTIKKGENCWHCHGPRKPARCAETLFCGDCGHIQPPAPSCNYFELMGVAQERFDLDVSVLDSNYKALMRRLHPDQFMMKKEQELEFSQAQCSAVNVAYSTLRCPFRRAKYMLRRMGVDFESSTCATDPEFMMEVLEASDEIDQAKKDQDRLLKVRDDFYQPQLSSCELDFESAYKEGDVGRAAAATARLQYLRRVKEQLREVVDVA